MGDPVATNIIVGGATLWNAPVAEAIPSRDSVDYGDDWGGNWERVGFTKAPLTMAYEPEEMDVEVEEALGAIKRVKIKESLMLETVLAEFTSDYLALVTGGVATTAAAGASTVGYDQVDLGGEVFTPELQWGFEGTYINAAGVKFPVRIFVWKATTIMNGSLSFSNRNGEYPGIPIQIKALQDITKDAGQQLMRMVRVTAAATG